MEVTRRKFFCVLITKFRIKCLQRNICQSLMHLGNKLCGLMKLKQNFLAGLSKGMFGENKV